MGLRAGTTFRYLFDLGEQWLHDCDVEQVGVDPTAIYGEEPAFPVPVFGWGTLPDQYGREHEEDEDDAAHLAWEPGEPEPGRLGLAPGDRPHASGDDLPYPSGDDLPYPSGDDVSYPSGNDVSWDEEDDHAFAAAWEEARADAWEVVAKAVAPVDRRVNREELARVARALRHHVTEDRSPYDVLWAAAELDELPEDDVELWTTLAAAVVEPRGELPVDLDVEAAWSALEPADWAGAVIELTRAGVGQSAEPDTLVDLIARCPEIEGPAFTPDDVETLELALTPVVDLWRVLGVVDDRHRLTALGRWGLPEALRVAWEPVP
jgi:predicted nucleotidyltransferase